MTRPIRVFFAIICCLLLMGLVLLSRGGNAPPKATTESATVAMTNNDCRRCHAKVFDEWGSSYHARAYRDDSVQAAFKHFGFDRNCESCHAPQPVLMTLGTPPVLRVDEHESGVNCLSCHAQANNEIAARHTVAGAPCRPVANASLTDGSLCGACHVAIHKDWLASSYFGKKSCQDCHMARDAASNHYSHACPGSHDEALVKSGVQMQCEQQASELVVRVKNHATGHNFPGERHNRVLLLQVIERSPGGEIQLAQQELIKGITPFRGESSAERIRAGEAFEARFVVEPPSIVEVKLLYKQFPFLRDGDALVVAEENVETTSP